jgi:HlyD family secretion protein
MITGITWSIMGRIPITVAGQGILIYPSTIVDTQTVGAGQLSRVNVKVGDFVKKGDVLATLAQPEIADQLRQQQTKITELTAQHRKARSLQTNRTGVTDQVTIQRKQSLQNQIQLAQKTVVKSKQRLSRWQWLKNQGASSGEEVWKVEQEFLQAEEKVRELQTQLQELATKKPEQQEKDYEASSNHQNQIQEAKRETAKLQIQLQQNNQIISQQSGQILELTMTPGQVLTAGAKVATLEARSPDTKLVGLSFFANGEGKQVQSGMKIEMTPNSVQRERFGGIMGTVIAVTSQPVTPEGVAKLIGNTTLAQSLMGQESKIQVAAKLQTDPASKSGFRWSSSKGPDFKVSSGSMANVRITVEERAPITFVLPILKSWMGQAEKSSASQPSSSSQPQQPPSQK